MPRLPRVECLPRGTVLRPCADETVLDAALRQGVALASSCGGHAVCGDCLVRVVRGAESLPPPGDEEIAWRRRTGYAGAGRLACLLRPSADCAVTTTYW